MNRQKSFSNNKPTLFLVATPIGNLEEMSYRAINTLKEVSLIAAEDTRNTIKLLNHFDIKTKMISHHEHNIKTSSIKVIEVLQEGQNVALVSDAGYPAISDPGYELVCLAIESNFNVVSISGSNACLNALVVSGIAPQPFLFYGFLDHTDKKKKTQLKEMIKTKETIVLYESPHRIKKTLKLIHEYFGSRNIALCRELTKKYEEIIRGTAEEILLITDELKGEMVLIIEGNSFVNETTDYTTTTTEHVDELVNIGLPTRDAIKEVAKLRNLKKNEVYNSYIKDKE